ncbi:Krueppel-like factor 15 [Blomia tropicalis]|nr:Krueppel-like factor 15 [Blomia tropicalis]
MSFGVSLQPSVVNSLVEVFFETKKHEIKTQLNEYVDTMFAQLMVQVKQLLIPSSADPNSQQPIPLVTNRSLEPFYSNSSVEMVNRKRKYSSDKSYITLTNMQVDGELMAENITQSAMDETTPSSGRNSISTAKKYNCEHSGCGKQFTKKQHFLLHRRFHLGLKPYHCTWTDCTYRSADRTSTIRHIRSHLKKARISETSTEDGDQMEPKQYLGVDQELLIVK